MLVLAWFTAPQSRALSRLCFASYIGYLFATVLNTKYYRDQQNFCIAKAWLHGWVVTQLEKEGKIGN